MTTPTRCRLGTRGSPLALVQAQWVRDRLLARHPELNVELIIVKTQGDLGEHRLGEGIFVKELEEALLDQRIDLAVHSLKDMPTQPPAGLMLAAYLEREDPRDCVISRFGEQLLELPRGAVVGTGSPRRAAQIKAAKKNIRVVSIRGNLDTRLRKVLVDGEVDSIVVALAGIKRLQREGDVSEILSTDFLLPAPGQGCVALEGRREDEGTRALVSFLNHEATAVAVRAERSYLAGLGGGCRVPIAALGEVKGAEIHLRGRVLTPDGQKKVEGTAHGALDRPEELGRQLAQELLSQGAHEILNSDKKE